MTCFRACWLFLLHWVCLCPMLFSFVSDSTCLLFTCLAIDCLLLRAETASLRLSKELYWGFPGGSVVNNLPASAGDAGDMGLIPGLERSPGEKHGNPLQYSCLENPVDRRAWRAAVHRVIQKLICTLPFPVWVLPTDSIRNPCSSTFRSSDPPSSTQTG